MPATASADPAARGSGTRSPRTGGTSTGLIATLAPECVYEIVGTGLRWEGHDGRAGLLHGAVRRASRTTRSRSTDIVIGPPGRVRGGRPRGDATEGPFAGPRRRPAAACGWSSRSCSRGIRRRSASPGEQIFIDRRGARPATRRGRAAAADPAGGDHLGLVGDLAVDREVEPDLFLVRRHAQAEDELDDLDDHERRDRRVGDRRADGDELGDQLAGVAVDQAREGVDRGRREDAGRDRAERAADAVDGEDVERVVDPKPLAQERRAVAQPADGEADERPRRRRSRSPTRA